MTWCFIDGLVCCPHCLAKCSLALQLGDRVLLGVGSHFHLFALGIGIPQITLAGQQFRMPFAQSVHIYQHPLRDNQPPWEQLAPLEVGLPG